MGQRFAGIAYVKADGNQLPLKGNYTVSPSRVERTGIAGQDYVHGFEESPRVPFIEGDISLLAEVSIEDLEAMTDVTVTAELANGKVYVLRNAWTKSAFELNTKEGTARVRWEGTDCLEIA
jgi:uncharacterized protein YlzI (FlbEa/FlbD family)